LLVLNSKVAAALRSVALDRRFAHDRHLNAIEGFVRRTVEIGGGSGNHWIDRRTWRLVRMSLDRMAEDRSNE
jgi:hypothetical protein